MVSLPLTNVLRRCGARVAPWAALGARPGVTLVECVVALVIGGLVTAAVASVMMAQAAVLRTASERSADADALRITAGVLRDELRWIDPARDVRAIAGDSLAVRLFRGGGAVCRTDVGSLAVDYSGARGPDPAKDSVLVLTTGAEAVFALTAAESTTCGSRPARRLGVAGALPGEPVFALIFESGTYYLRDRAFRYRLGREGRQPLTDERFAPAGPIATIAPDSARAGVRMAWPAQQRRPVDTLFIRFVNGRR